MDTLTRRRFLVASGVTGGAALAAGASAVTWRQLHQAAQANPRPTDAKTLVIVTLYGGNDGLGTVIPYADSAYHSARPDLAYSPSDVLKLDGSLGLNPSMKGFASLWKNKQLAVVRGVGYPKPDHSHFRSMDIWQTASPDEPVNTGWIGRWLDASGDDPLRAVDIGNTLPPLCVGLKATAASLQVGVDRTAPKEVAAAFTALGMADPADRAAAAMVCESYRAERTVATKVTPALSSSGSTDGDDDAGAGGSSAGGQGGLAAQLDVVSRCIKAGVPTQVYSVSLGGFDTHADEKGTQATQLGQLDIAASNFLADMAKDPRGAGVVLLVYTEFGRRVAANASQGTDHGTAGPVFVAGRPVRGGFYGEQPSLTDLDNGDLKSSTDFRAVYGELLHKVLDADPAKVLGSDRSELGFL
ncbi:MAG: DUF1501 domain-containing protein [Jatrophihabitans sp.]